MFLAEMSQLIGDHQTLIDALRRDEIERHFNTTIHVAHLMWRTRRYEDGIAQELQHRERMHVVLARQSLHHLSIDVVDLIVDRIRALFQHSTFEQLFLKTKNKIIAKLHLK